MPGKSSISKWPFANKHARASLICGSLPRMMLFRALSSAGMVFSVGVEGTEGIRLWLVVNSICRFNKGSKVRLEIKAKALGGCWTGVGLMLSA